VAYQKQTWVDYDPRYPMSASRFQHIENGIEAAFDEVAQVKGIVEAPATEVVQDVLDTSISDPASTVRTTLDDGYAPRSVRDRHAPAFGVYFPEAEGALGGGNIDTVPIRNALAAAIAGKGWLHLQQPHKVDGAITAGVGARITNDADGQLVAAAVMARLVDVQGLNTRIEGVTLDSGTDSSGNDFVTSELMRIGTSTSGPLSAKHKNVTLVGHGKVPRGVYVESSLTILDSFQIDGCQTGIQCTQSLVRTRIYNPVITNWVERGIYVLGSDDGAGNYTSVVDFVIDGGRITDMAPGGTSRYPCRIQGGSEAHPHQNVTIRNLLVQGTGTSYTDPVNPGTADQISLAYVHGFKIHGIWSFDGGDGGMTIEAECANGTISDYHIYRSDSVGIFLGASGDTYVRNIAVGVGVIKDCGQNRQGNVANPCAIKAQHLQKSSVVGAVLGNEDGTACPVGVYMKNCDNLELGPNVNNGLTVALYRNDGGNTNVRIHGAQRTIVKPSDTTLNNTATLTTDPHLTTAVESNATYDIELLVSYNATTTGDINFHFTGPAGMVFNWLASGLATASTTGTGQVSFAKNTVGGSRPIGGSGASAMVLIKGIMTTSTASGTFALQWAQSTAEASDCTVQAGSWMKPIRIS